MIVGETRYENGGQMVCFFCRAGFVRHDPPMNVVERRQMTPNSSSASSVGIAHAACIAATDDGPDFSDADVLALEQAMRLGGMALQ